MRSPRRALLLAASLLLVATPSIHAQSAARLRVGITAPVPPREESSLLGMPRVESRSYWKEGFIIGTVLGTLVILPFAGWDGDSITPSDVLIAVVGGSLIGGVPGALIGGLFPKRQNGE